MVDGYANGRGKKRGSLSTSQRRYLWIAGICAAGLIASYWVRLAGVLIPTTIFLPLHIVLEFSSIIVSFAVFVTGWFGYRQSGNTRDLFLGLVFLATGLLDFLHTFTYQGMPAFLGPSGVQKATTFWTLARFWAGVGLLSACFIKPRFRHKMLSPAALLLQVMAATLIVIWLVIHFYPASGSLFYNLRESRLTDLKIGAEYFIILLYAAAFLLCTRKRGWDENKVLPLRSALLVAMFAEVAFTMYGSPFALTNFLGHVYKTGSYYLILGALFVSSIRRPYQELSDAKEELQVLYADAQDHRREIEQSFARIGSALSSSIRLDEALGQIADLAIGMLHAHCSVVASLPKGHSGHQVSAQRGDTHTAGRAIEVAIEVGKNAMEQQLSSVLNNDLEAAGLIECDFSRPDCLRSMVCAPMFLDGEALGVIAAYAHDSNAFDDGDRKLLEAFASHAAVAIHNAMIYERESRIADVLQRTFLSPGQLVSEGFEIAHVYASAMAEAQVGGDFYDVIDLGAGKIGLVIGDVSGKGLAAAVHTAMAKYSLRAYLSEGHSPGDALNLLNRTITESTSIETFITLFCAVLDTHTRQLIYASAGHEPAIYAAGEDYATLDSTGPAVGLGIDLGYQDVPLTMKPGSVLLLYTDGVSEARHGHTFLGTQGIVDHLMAHSDHTSEALAKSLYEAAVEFSGGDMRDDVAILAVKATA